MNITGYKRKHQTMKDILKRELQKKDTEQSRSKIKRLEDSIRNCSKKLKQLQKAGEDLRDRKGRPKRFKGTQVKGRRRIYAKV